MRRDAVETSRPERSGAGRNFGMTIAECCRLYAAHRYVDTYQSDERGGHASLRPVSYRLSPRACGRPVGDEVGCRQVVTHGNNGAKEETEDTCVDTSVAKALGGTCSSNHRSDCLCCVCGCCYDIPNKDTVERTSRYERNRSR